MTRLKGLSDEDPNGGHRKQLKEYILTRLRRTVPSTTLELNAIQTQSGEVTADPAGIAAALQEHWGQVFGGRDLDQIQIAEWLATLPHLQANHNTWTQCTEISEDSVTHHDAKAKRGRRQSETNTPPRAGARRPTLPTDQDTWRITYADVARALE